jgi:hypothetical protein
MRATKENQGSTASLRRRCHWAPLCGHLGLPRQAPASAGFAFLKGLEMGVSIHGGAQNGSKWLVYNEELYENTIDLGVIRKS